MWVPIITLTIVALYVYFSIAGSSIEKKMVENDAGRTPSIKAICTEGIEHFQNEQKVKLKLLSDKMLISQGESSVSLSFYKITDAHFDKIKELRNGILAAKAVEIVDLYIKYNDENDTTKQLVFKDLSGDASFFEKVFMKRVFPESQNVPPPPSTLCGAINHHKYHISFQIEFVIT